MSKTKLIFHIAKSNPKCVSDLSFYTGIAFICYGIIAAIILIAFKGAYLANVYAVTAIVVALMVLSYSRATSLVVKMHVLDEVQAMLSPYLEDGNQNPR